MDKIELKKALEGVYEEASSCIKFIRQRKEEIMAWMDCVKSDAAKIKRGKENNYIRKGELMPKTPAIARRLRERNTSSTKKSNTGPVDEVSCTPISKSSRNASKNALLMIQKQAKLNLRDKMRRPVRITNNVTQKISTSKYSVVIPSETEKSLLCIDTCKRLTRSTYTTVAQAQPSSKQSECMSSENEKLSVGPFERTSRLTYTDVTQGPSNCQQFDIIPCIAQECYSIPVNSSRITKSHAMEMQNDIHLQLHDQTEHTSRDSQLLNQNQDDILIIPSCDQNSNYENSNSRMKIQNNGDLQQNEMKRSAMYPLPTDISVELVSINNNCALEENCENKTNEGGNSNFPASITCDRKKPTFWNGPELQVKLHRLPHDFSHYGNLSGKTCATSYENLSLTAQKTPVRITRTKTRAMAAAITQASQNLPSKVKNKELVIKLARCSVARAKMIVLKKTKPTPAEELRIEVNSPIHLKAINNQLEEQRDEERRKLELKEIMALQRREEMLKHKTDTRRRKREEKMVKVMLTRQANDKEKHDHNQRLDQEKKNKLEQVAKDRETKLKEEVLKMKQQTSEKAARAEERRRMKELQLIKINEQEEKEQTSPKRQLKEVDKTRKKTKTVSTVAEYNNYSIKDVQSDESTDDEDNPKKKIPLWGHRYMHHKIVWMQAYMPKKIQNVFICCENKTPDLTILFNGIDKKLLERTSSAVWNTPPCYSTLLEYYLK